MKDHHDDFSMSTTSTDLDFLSPKYFRKDNQPSETLPANQNTSYIGARISPIAFDDEEDEDQLLTAPYQQVLRDHSYTINERSGLLANQIRWDEPSIPRQPTKRHRKAGVDWGTVVCTTAGVQLASIALHDVYLAYLSYRLGYDVDVERWSLISLAPSDFVLTRFGAFVPSRLFFNREWWRMITCAMMCTSVLEWLSVFAAWHVLRMGGTSTRMWCWTYLLSVLTGQIWMMAWDSNGISGCAAWGTCGVLSATSSTNPQQRILLIGVSSVMGVLALLEPTNSFIGTIGAVLFGWAFNGLGWSRVGSKLDKDALPTPRGVVRFFYGLILVKLWVIPLLCIAFFQPDYEVSERAFSMRVRTSAYRRG